MCFVLNWLKVMWISFQCRRKFNIELLWAQISHCCQMLCYVWHTIPNLIRKGHAALFTKLKVLVVLSLKLIFLSHKYTATSAKLHVSDSGKDLKKVGEEHEFNWALSFPYFLGRSNHLWFLLSKCLNPCMFVLRAINIHMGMCNIIGKFNGQRQYHF